MQQSKYDQFISEAIAKSDIVVDTKSGIVYGKPSGSQGVRCDIGYPTQRGIAISLRVGNTSRLVYRKRVVYIASNTQIAGGFLVANGNGDINDDRIENLYLTPAPKSAPTANVWSQSDLDKIISMREDSSLTQIASAVGRSIKSVRQKLASLAVAKKPQGGRWTQSEDSTILSMFASGSAMQDIANAVVRSVGATRMRINRFHGQVKTNTSYKEKFRSKNFYASLRQAIRLGKATASCCVCGYDKHVHLHHIDSSRSNNAESNIATLCPNHHAEADSGDFTPIQLRAVWERKLVVLKHPAIASPRDN